MQIVKVSNRILLLQQRGHVHKMVLSAEELLCSQNAQDWVGIICVILASFERASTGFRERLLVSADYEKAFSLFLEQRRTRYFS